MKTITKVSLSIVAITAGAMFFTNGLPKASSNASGAPAGATGSPADGMDCTGCHSGPSPIVQAGMITSNVPGTGYVPGSTYAITGTITRAGHTKFGFEISPQSATGTELGTIAVTSSQTQIVSTKYITHTTTGTSGSGTKSWTFNWTAPVAGTGAVTFYGAFNATNANNNNQGDTILTSTLVLQEHLTTGIAENNIANAAVKIFPTIVQSEFTINYQLKENSLVDVKIIDINGKMVKQILSEKQSLGEHNIIADCSELANGVYLVHTIINGDTNVKKIIVRK